MPWTRGPISRRRTQLPPNWPAITRAVRARAGGQCEMKLDNGQRCPDPGTDTDHIDNPNDHSMTNLRWLCPWHHDHRTAQQGANAQAAQRAKLTHPSHRTT